MDAETVKVVAQGLGLEFEAEKSGDAGKFAPIDLLDYIYLGCNHDQAIRATSQCDGEVIDRCKDSFRKLKDS